MPADLEKPDAHLAAETPAPAETTLHRIVVVGGGAAGLELATRLGETVGRRRLAQVTLVDKARTHLWKPLLHAIAAGSMDPGAHELNYLAQAYWHHFRYQFGELVGLDRAHRQIHLGATVDEEGREITPPRSLPYDTLVIAVGSMTNDFGTPGATEHAVPLETPDQARRFNRRLVNACLRAHLLEDVTRSGQLHVAIIGAGATGTELAAELHRTTREVVAYGLDRINPETDIRITLIEAAPRILPALSERIAEKADHVLRDLGVDIRTGARVVEVTESGVRLANGEFVDSALIVWCAGIKGPDVLRDLDGLEVNAANQLVVLPTLQTTRDTNVFAIGDCAACPRPDDPKPVPPRAQAAHQQASHMVQEIKRRLAGQPLQPFVYRDFGSLVSFGRYGALGNLMGALFGGTLFIEGYLARMMYRSLYRMHEAALHGAGKATLNALTRTVSRLPVVKLH